MPGMSPLTGLRWFTAWQWSWPGAICGLALLALLAVVIRRSGQRRPSGWRIAGYLAGVGSLLYVTCGPVGVYSSILMWVFGIKVGVLSSLTPIGLAMGRPSGATLAAALPRPLLAVCRVLAFPGLSSVIVTVSVIAIVFSGYGQASTTSTLVDAILVVHLLVVGSLVTVPLLVDGLLPAWAGAGMRTLLAVVDGLLDALPGILLMTAGSLAMPGFPGFAARWSATRNGLSPTFDQRLAGGSLLATAESVGLPLLGLVFVEWMRQDARTAKEYDAQQDSRLAAARMGAGSAPAADAAGLDPVTTDGHQRAHDDLPEGSTRPWWLDDPDLSERYRPGD